MLVNLLLCMIMLSVTYTCIHTSIMKSLEIMIGTGGTAPSTCETLSFVETSVPDIRCTSSAVNVEPSPLSPVYSSNGNSLVHNGTTRPNECSVP